LRIALGVILIWKGINFFRDTSIVESLTNQSSAGVFTKNEAIIALAVTILTLLCGFFIMIGFFTRIASFVQLPVFSIGAILYIHGGYIERNGFELALTIVIPFLLLLSFTKGSSAFSIDECLRRKAAFNKKSSNSLMKASGNNRSE
jgi:uncharacterized membrane protein YphA (DoxX/SURF4 family)